MDNSDLDRVSVTPGQYQLLGGWGDVLGDIRLLSRSLSTLPDGCACGQGASHLAGSCSCCHTEPGSIAQRCSDCERRLIELRARIDELTADTMRFFPTVTELLHGPGLEPAGEAADQIEHEIVAVIRAFDGLSGATDDFRSGCRASNLSVVKQCAATLLDDVDRLNRCLVRTVRRA
jgi:hypothetical protein